MYVGVRRNWLALARPLGVGTATMDLKGRIRVLAAQNARALGHSRFQLMAILRLRRLLLLLLLLLRLEMGLSFGRVEVGLAILQMLNLASRVVCANEAPV